jgi:hypothetical protein
MSVVKGEHNLTILFCYTVTVFALVNGFIDNLHDSELQAITAPTIISIIHKSPQNLLSLFQSAVSSPAVPWQRLLTVKIPQLNSLQSCLHRLMYRTDSVAPIVFKVTSRHGPSRIPRFRQYLYCCASVRCSGYVFTEPLPRNGCDIFACLAAVT